MTTNLCLNRIRDARNRTRLLEEQVAPVLRDLATESAVDWTEARRLVDRMPEDLALVTVYRSVDGMTHEEIADVMGCSRRHVNALLNRAQIWAQTQESE